jgi:hypothetical protein
LALLLPAGKIIFPPFSPAREGNRTEAIGSFDNGHGGTL